MTRLAEDVQAELQVLVDRSEKYWRKRLKDKLPFFKRKDKEIKEELTSLSSWEARPEDSGNGWAYVSPQAKTDRTITCPNSSRHGCQDQWAPDLFDENAGVCAFCGHHFPMEYEWYLYNVFDPGSIFKFNHQLEAGNPLGYEGLALKLDEAKKKTGQKSGCMTFETRIKGITMNVAMFMANFRGGSVGAAEGEKFIRAIELARKRHLPFLAYVHGTAGIRIQEGTNGVVQMPRCTMAARPTSSRSDLPISDSPAPESSRKQPALTSRLIITRRTMLSPEVTSRVSGTEGRYATISIRPCLPWVEEICIIASPPQWQIVNLCLQYEPRGSKPCST